MHLLALLLAVVIVAVAPGSATAQDTTVVQVQAWTDIATIYNFGDHFRYDGDYGLRGAVTGIDFTQAYIRPSCRWQPKSWLTLHGGAAWFQTWIKDGLNASEIRLWAGVRLVGPRPWGWTVSNYFRLEQRNFHIEGHSGWDGVWRARWQLQIRTPDFRVGSVKRLYALTSIEPFDNLGTSLWGDVGVDRIRFVAAAGKKVGRGWRVEFDYTFQATRLSDDTVSFDLSDNILRLRFFYNIN
jgi:hypothetical protein